MLLITKQQRNELDRVGLLRYKKTGGVQQDQNFMVTNRTGKGNKKSYYVVEDFNVLAFLEEYDSLNLQKISKDQLNKLKQDGLVDETTIQRPGEYIPNALVYIDSHGQARIRRDPRNPKLMIAVGIWKSRN